MSKFKVGDVWWAKFPYEDKPEEYTIRPVVILDNATVGLLSVKVTKHEAREYDPYDTPIMYWNEAGLKLASTARVSKTMILDSSRFKELIGSLHPDDLRNIQEQYIKLIESE